MTAGKVAMLIIGVIVGLFGLTLMVGGATLIGVHATARDSDGFYSTSTHRFATSTAALQADLNLVSDEGYDKWVPGRTVGTGRLSADSTNEHDVFIGIGHKADVEQYLANAPYAHITDLNTDPVRLQTEERTPVATGTLAPPASESIWAASAVGTGKQNLQWDLRSGDWDVVIMNADASPGVSIDGSAAVKTNVLLPIGIVTLIVGLIFGVAGTVLIVYAVRRQVTPSTPRPAPAPPSTEGLAMGSS